MHLGVLFPDTQVHWSASECAVRGIVAPRCIVSWHPGAQTCLWVRSEGALLHLGVAENYTRVRMWLRAEVERRIVRKKEAEIPFEISALAHSLLQSQWETLFGVSWNFGFAVIQHKARTPVFLR